MAGVIAVVMAVHSLWIAIYVAEGHEARDFIHIGLCWASRSTVSADITVDPNCDYPRSRSIARDVPRG